LIAAWGQPLMVGMEFGKEAVNIWSLTNLEWRKRPSGGPAAEVLAKRIR
jgi:hypothetical protein